MQLTSTDYMVSSRSKYGRTTTNTKVYMPWVLPLGMEGRKQLANAMRRDAHNRTLVKYDDFRHECTTQPAGCGVPTNKSCWPHDKHWTCYQLVSAVCWMVNKHQYLHEYNISTYMNITSVPTWIPRWTLHTTGTWGYSPTCLREALLRLDSWIN
jgi:hypothetical protein